jgi:FKBP-type peptidyl-prolyl cis-trans isomerase SlyD
MAIVTNDVVALTYKLHTIENGEKVFVEETTTENPFDIV